MADHDQHLVSSTSSFLNDEVHHYQAEPEPQAQPGPRDDLYAVDDIVDLVGGAQDALERHRAEDSTAQEEPGTVRVLDPEPEPEEEPVPEPKPVLHNLLDPEPVPEPALFKALDPETEPVKVSDPEPEQVKLLQTEPDPVPDTTTTGPLVLEHPAVTAPKAEPENTQITAPAVEPPATRPADTPGERAPSPAAAVERRPATEDASAPAYLRDLLYWRDVKATGVVFGAALLLLLSLTVCSIVSVSSYIGLALLSVTVTFRIYRGVLQAVQKSDEGHPFRHYLDQEVALSEDTLHKYSDAALDKVNRVITELRHLFLVEDLVDSIKFAGLMWILTYVGALFNGLTVLILGETLNASNICSLSQTHHTQCASHDSVHHVLSLCRSDCCLQLSNHLRETPGRLRPSVCLCVCVCVCTHLSVCVSGSDRSLSIHGQQADQRHCGKVSQRSFFAPS
uniref:Reticulon n=1 Tax=Gouania willdenowi TaxID=441366 RepID=A0A8C5H0I7_GOUWI